MPYFDAFSEDYYSTEIDEPYKNQAAVQKKCIHKQCAHIATVECKKYAVPVCYECERKIHKNCSSNHFELREVAQSDEELLVKINLFDEMTNRVHLFMPTSEFDSFCSSQIKERERKFQSKFCDDYEEFSERRIFCDN